MYLDFEVEIPVLESGISKKRIKGTTYIYYEHGRKYYSDKQYTVPQCTSIGKMCEDDPSMMNPNGNYLKFFPDAYRLELTKEVDEEVSDMCSYATAMENKGIQRGIQQGIQKGIQQERRELIDRMLKNGLAPAQVADLTGVSLDEIQEIGELSTPSPLS